jgi:hypothetical protein
MFNTFFEFIRTNFTGRDLMDAFGLALVVISVVWFAKRG